MAGLRLDLLLEERGLAPSRARAQALILAGRVRVAGRQAVKAGTRLPADAEVEVLADPNPYVSRAGRKLAGALAAFSLTPDGWSVLEVGASTGGFTDCLLQAGARRVVALDVGHGQLDWGLRNDPRVVVVERCNARYLTPAALEAAAGGPVEPLDLAVVDVSFISLALILPPLAQIPSLGRAVCLVKPQFEAGRDQIGRGGIVRGDATHTGVLERVGAYATAAGWLPQGLCASPLRGAAGNREFFLDLARAGGAQPATPFPFAAALAQALATEPE
jgi:23S rRNA (cytidine1920-2'-O)/16S rRNA (cytidine1409-2'-O)-methyltransferase